MHASDYTEYRPLMFSIAYRMTGSVSDAEDIVQEAFLRATRNNDTTDNEKAYLATITTRLAIDHLRSARVRRESYIGTWLPEPLVGDADHAPGPAELAETSDSLSMAFLVLLESLSPPERAVFLLREVFGYGYPEIAEVTGKTEAACRQIFARARRRIEEGRPRFETSRAEGEELTSLFLAAARGGDMVSGLIAVGHEVTGSTRSALKASQLEGRGATPVIVDGLDREAIIKAVTAAEPEVTIHQMTALASMRSFRSNEKAKRELGWTPAYPSWRDGFPVWAEKYKAAHADAS